MTERLSPFLLKQLEAGVGSWQLAVASSQFAVSSCSRSVCANFAEAYRRRKYPAHLVSKITDSDAENAETEVWLDFALACKYINADEYRALISQKEEVGKLLNDILNNPGKYC